MPVDELHRNGHPGVGTALSARPSGRARTDRRCDDRGYHLRAGSLLSINTYALQRDARFHADPERFDPERFSAGWEERIPRYGYLPFAGGPAGCIGNAFAMMEARLILATVAQRYKLLLKPIRRWCPYKSSRSSRGGRAGGAMGWGASGIGGHGAHPLIGPVSVYALAWT
jgi:cytochrome P450